MPIILVAALILALATALPPESAGDSPVAFDQQDGRLVIQIDGKPFADYVWQDSDVVRPYFSSVHAPDGTQVTRNHPPVANQDAPDHATMHPGLWLAFGDVSGADFWRNTATVQHVEFVEPPQTTLDGGEFAVRNRYKARDKTICEEVCRIKISVRPGGYLIDWVSEFTGPDEFTFGDQEEMGLAVRLATPLTVNSGGRILNSHGMQNEAQVWGKQADWCDYTGQVNGKSVGIALLSDPQNFRRPWFHARDYGLLVANPFGQNAFTKGEKSSVTVSKGDILKLHFGVLVHSGEVDLPAEYDAWLNKLERVEVGPDKTAFISFYWGKPPSELRPPKGIGDAIVLDWLTRFEKRSKKLP